MSSSKRDEGECQQPARETGRSPPGIPIPIQCCHSLGQQIVGESRLPLGDYGRSGDNRIPIVHRGRVFPHDVKHAPCRESRGLLWDESFVRDG